MTQPPVEEAGWLYAELAADGSAGLALGAKRVELAAPPVPAGDGLRAGRAQMLAELRTIAEAVGRPVRVQITDPDGVWPVQVSPDPAVPPTALPAPPTPPAEPLEPVEPGEPLDPAVRRVRPVLRPAPDPVRAAPAPAPEPALEPPAVRPEPATGPATDPGTPVPAEIGGPSRPSFDDLLAARPDPYNAPATEGWRGVIRQVSKGRLRPAPGSAERAHRDRIRRIQKPLDGPRVIAVVNPKGGVYKTTSALLLAQKLGTLRGGRVCFYDNNEARATAAWRAMPAAHTRTVEDLLHRIHDLRERPITGISDLRGYLRSQGPAGFDLLAAAESENPMEERYIPAGDVNDVIDTLGRFYEVIVVDTGNKMGAPNWGAAVLRAHQMVIVSTVREDAALSAGWLAQALQRAGREELLANAVTTLSAPLSAEPDLHKRFHSHFAQLTRAVDTMPFDPALDQGRPIDWNALSDATHAAWEYAAADVMDGL